MFGMGGLMLYVGVAGAGLLFLISLVRVVIVTDWLATVFLSDMNAMPVGCSLTMMGRSALRMAQTIYCTVGSIPDALPASRSKSARQSGVNGPSPSTSADGSSISLFVFGTAVETTPETSESLAVGAVTSVVGTPVSRWGLVSGIVGAGLWAPIIRSHMAPDTGKRRQSMVAREARDGLSYCSIWKALGNLTKLEPHPIRRD